jgi:hypothetical protein
MFLLSFSFPARPGSLPWSWAGAGHESMRLIRSTDGILTGGIEADRGSKAAIAA